MLQLSILFIWLTILAVLILLKSKYELLSPEFGFVACFIPSVLYAFLYVDIWSLNLSTMTVFTIMIGTFSFVITSFLTRPVCKMYIKLNPIVKSKSRTMDVNEYIASWKIHLIIGLQIIALICTIMFLISEFGTDLSYAMFAFRVSSMSVNSDDYVKLPLLLRALRRVCLASGYVVMFLLLNSVVYGNKKNRSSELICVLLSLFNGSTLGGRGESLQLLAAGVIQYLLISRRRNGKNFIQKKSLLKVFMLTGIIILTFAQIGELMGRNMSFLKFDEYIAVYLSAELKNLDIFVRRGVFGADVASAQTLTNVINVLAVLFNKPEWIHSLDLPFNYINGYALGNVCTIFFAFLYDGGLTAVVIYTSLMAAFCQKLYQSSLKSEMRSDISISTILYSFTWFTVVFSFFSNKFYEIVFSTIILWCMGTWTVLKWFFMQKITFR